jgi:site-specific recombinases, DNA invertase pin homologs
MAKRERRFEAPVQDMETLIPVIKTAGYVRLSVDKNDRKTESIENQKQVIEAYINRHNENPERKFVLELAGFYEDKGLTGTDFDRKGFENLINDAKSGQINCIIVKDFSRFGRDFLDGCNYIENVLPFLEVRFIAISDQYDSMAHDAASRRFEVRLKNLINEMYALESSEKVSDVKALSQRRGSFIGSRCPYGYRAEWVNGIRTLFPSGDAALEVQRMYAMYLNGATINDILDYLYEKRVNRPKEWLETGKTYAEENEPIFRWRRGSVQDILRNVVYAGDMAQGKYRCRLYEGQKQRQTMTEDDWVVVENTHEALVSKEDFRKASQRVNDELNVQISTGGKKPKRERKNAIYENIFADVVYCGDCGKRLGAMYYQGRIKDVRRYRYYCRGAYVKDHRQCVYKSIAEDKLIEIFQCVIRETLKAYGIRGKDLTQANNKAAQNVIDDIQREQKELLKKKDALEDIIQEAYFDMKRGNKTLLEYNEVRHDAQAKATKYGNEIAALDKRLMHFNREVERQNKFLRSLLKANTTRKLDKVLVNEIVDSIYLYEDERVVINLKIKGGDVCAVG